MWKSLYKQKPISISISLRTYGFITKKGYSILPKNKLLTYENYNIRMNLLSKIKPMNNYERTELEYMKSEILCRYLGIANLSGPIELNKELEEKIHLISGPVIINFNVDDWPNGPYW